MALAKRIKGDKYFKEIFEDVNYPFGDFNKLDRHNHIMRMLHNGILTVAEAKKMMYDGGQYTGAGGGGGMSEYNNGYAGGSFSGSITSQDYIYQTTIGTSTNIQPIIQWVTSQPILANETVDLQKQMKSKAKELKPETAFEWLRRRVEEIRLTPAMMMAATAV